MIGKTKYRATLAFGIVIALALGIVACAKRTTSSPVRPNVGKVNVNTSVALPKSLVNPADIQGEIAVYISGTMVARERLNFQGSSTTHTFQLSPGNEVCFEVRVIDPQGQPHKQTKCVNLPYSESTTLSFIFDLGLNVPGQDWSQATANAGFSPRYGHTTVSYGNKIWVIGGTVDPVGPTFSNEVWSSPDGISWTQATPNAAFSPRGGHTSLVFAGKMWVIGGFAPGTVRENDVWWSTDGVDWNLATPGAGFAGRYLHTSVVHNGFMWVIGGWIGGGNTADVWYSSDGASWLQATPTANFGTRSHHSSVVHNGKMWLIGGLASVNNYRNDVWSSSDGITWNQATANAGFPLRGWHSSEIFNPGSLNKMWVIAGANTSGHLNDVWSSGNGITWTAASQNADFAPRSFHSSVTFAGKMWVIGGSDSSTNTIFNDVWHTP